MVSASSTPGPDVWALDFDGVICDSVGESCLAAWKASTQLWPTMFAQPSIAGRQDEIVGKLRTVRPVIETGYEFLVLVRCLLDGVTPDQILADWHPILEERMTSYGLNRAELLTAFGGARDAMMATDLDAWIDLNAIYPGVADSVRLLAQRHELYIVTTKQARFAEAILHRLAGIDLDPARIFSQAESGRPKSEVLHVLETRHPGGVYHFVEDKALTLLKVDPLENLRDWKLYLVDWGYNTPAERTAAEQHPRIQLINLEQFHAMAEQQ